MEAINSVELPEPAVAALNSIIEQFNQGDRSSRDPATAIMELDRELISILQQFD
jgi:hypothetical protein